MGEGWKRKGLESYMVELEFHGRVSRRELRRLERNGIWRVSWESWSLIGEFHGRRLEKKGVWRVSWES